MAAPGWDTWIIAACLAGLTGLVCRLWEGRARRRTFRDEMAEQSAVEEALRVSEAHYRGLFEATSDGLVVVTVQGLVLDVNPAAEQLMGAEPGDMLGRPLERYVDTSGPQAIARRTDGATITIACTRTPFGAGQELVTLTDLEEQLALRSRLAHAERLEAVGRLAGGVAHDFNNLLTALRANTDVLRRHVESLPEPTEALECVEGIVEGAERGVTLTGQLLAFGRRQVLHPETVGPAHFLRRVTPLLRRLLRDDLVLHVASPDIPSGWGIHVDSGQLEVSLMNLVINAADAMPRGGRVCVELFRRQDHVVFAVEDTGHGISSDVLPHIFEPFYTTKRDAGSGLGLASVHGFVVQSGGTVEARNVAKGGARFEMVLPLVDPPSHLPPDPVEIDLDPDPPTGEVDPSGAPSERIVLIDDDDQVRRTVQRMLRSADYDVQAFSNGPEGLAYLTDADVDLLITDVVMPGMSGIKVAEQLGDELPVIFISGYTDDVIDDLRGRFLAKPFLPQELLAIVRATLDEAQKRRSLTSSSS